jgi:acetyl esterase/lipase
MKNSRKRFFLILVLMVGSVLAWSGNVAGAGRADAKVAWPGKSFLDVTYKQVKGHDIKLDIYMPTGEKTEAAPLIYYVHGGGWTVGGKDKGGLPLMLPVFKRLAEKGFVCVSIDYRLYKKNNGVIIRDCFTDAVDGLRFLKKHAGRYGIDPERVVVWGDSAGGQLAQMLTYADPAAFPGDESLAGYDVHPTAGMSWYGPTDFTDVDLFKTDLSDKDPDRFGFRLTGQEGGYAKFPEAYKEMSPYFCIRKESPPLLLLQGDADATIPFVHATHLKNKADKIGADVTMIVVKNAGHNWRRAGGAINPSLEDIQRMTADFALKQIKAVRN